MTAVINASTGLPFAPGTPWLMTLRDCMDHHAQASPDRIAVLEAAGPISYREVHARAQSVAAGLQSLGVGKGDIVAAQLPNGIEFLLCYLAASYVGAILQTIHMPYRTAEIEPLLQHSKAKVAICLAREKGFSPSELVLSLLPRLPALETVIAVGPDAPAGSIPFATLESGRNEVRAAAVPADSPYLLLYTSGTTSAPKGISATYAKFLANAHGLGIELGIDDRDILLSVAPFTHLYGLFSINLALVTGACSAMLPAFSPGSLAAALDAYRPTGILTAPAHVAACLNEGLFTKERLSSLRFMAISGSAVPPDLARAVQGVMVNGAVCQLWGMTELQVGALTRLDDPEQIRLSTAGRASPGTELRIMDGTALLPPGAEGELQVRGISVFERYLDNPEASLDAFTDDGWFRTGDLAVMDEQGNIRITGRLKEIINRGGIKFNPAEVEAVIDRHPAVMSSAIVPMPDEVLGERACCFIVPMPGMRVALDDLRSWLAGHHVAKHRWPERVEAIDEMPMTATRKIRKTELATLLTGMR